MTISIPEPVLTSEQKQAANLDRRIILFATDVERIGALRRYWQAMLQVAVLGVPFPDDFPTLIGALAMQTVQIKNDLENAQTYIKNRGLSASLSTCAAAIARENKRHQHATEQRLMADAHNAEFVLHSDAMLRLNDNHEKAWLAIQACEQFERTISHLLNVSAYINELASNAPEAAIQN